MFSIALLVTAVIILEPDRIWEIMRKGIGLAFAASIMIVLVHFLVMGARWYLLVRSLIRLPFLQHFSFYLLGTFFNTFTPSNVGGDVYRVSVLRPYSKSSWLVVWLLLRERILGLYGFMITFLIAVAALGYKQPSLFASARPFALGTILAMLVLLLPLYIGILKRFVEKALLFFQMPKISASWLTVSGRINEAVTFKESGLFLMMTLLALGLWVVAIQIIAVEMGLKISLLELMAVATLVEIIRLVPVTIQGIGLREGVFAYLLSSMGYDASETYALAFVAYLALSAAIVITGPLGNLMSLLCSHRKVNKSNSDTRTRETL